MQRDPIQTRKVVGYEIAARRELMTKAKATAKYALRWMKYHVSYESRRRSARIELIAMTTSMPVPIVAGTMNR